MLVALADTHATDAAPTTGAVGSALSRATVLVHAGDFTTAAVLEDLRERTDRMAAVAGNRDTPAVRERLPAVRTVDALGARFLVAHGHDHDPTSLSLLARQERADAAIVGHTHRPGIDRVGDLPVINPGSHADPRGSRAAFATVSAEGEEGEGVSVRLRTTAGEPFETAALSGGPKRAGADGDSARRKK